jgi:hypothetical protein
LNQFNFDAAIINYAFFAAVSRDSHGSILSVSSSSDLGCSLAFAEAKAALFTISTAIAQGHKLVMCEGDAQSVINSIIDQSLDPHWELRSTIVEIRILLCNFSSVIFRFCPKASNGLAHNLARWASFCSSWGPLPISSILFWALVDVDGLVPLGASSS